MKFATVTAVLLMIIVCVLLPKLPAIHTWAVEREEERIAEAELAEQKITMSDLTIKNTEVEHRLPKHTMYRLHLYQH